MDCKKCSQHIDEAVDLYTVCEGRCAKPFHATCVGLEESQLEALSQNIIWLCDDCLADFLQRRDQTQDQTESEPEQQTPPATSVEDEIREMKNTISTITDTLAKLTATPAALSPTVQHSTPMSSVGFLSGSNANYECTVIEDSSSIPTPTMEESSSFSLLLSNIGSLVSEKQISKLVSQCIGAPLSDCADVTKLVPKWKNCRTMDYISFKIVLNADWKHKALEPSTWPCNVKFREFVSRNKTTWNPQIVS